MIPIPTVIAGVLIGAANDTWGSVLTISTLVWPLTFCVYGTLVDSPQLVAMADKMGSKVNAYLVEFCTAALTALPFAVIAHLVRRVFT